MAPMRRTPSASVESVLTVTVLVMMMALRRKRLIRRRRRRRFAHRRRAVCWLLLFRFRFLLGRRVEVFFGFEDVEKRLDEFLGILLEEDFHLRRHRLPQFRFRLVLLDQGQNVSTERNGIRVASAKLNTGVVVIIQGAS